MLSKHWYVETMLRAYIIFYALALNPTSYSQIPLDGRDERVARCDARDRLDRWRNASIELNRRDALRIERTLGEDCTAKAKRNSCHLELGPPTIR